MSDSGKPAPPDAVSSESDRRQSVRYLPRPENAYLLVAEAGDKVCPAKVYNVSALGIAIQVSRRFEPGTLLTIDVQSTAGVAPQTLLMRVTHVVEQGDGTFIVGGAFTAKPSGFDLLTLLA